MREPLEIDDLEFRGRTPEEHREVAGILLGWATERHPDDDEEVTPAELLARAGEHLGMAGDHQEALEAFRRALAAEGPATIDVRCNVHHELLALGDVDGARSVAEEVRRSKPDDPEVYVWIGEDYELTGDLGQANRWMNLALQRVLEEIEDDELSPGAYMVLVARRRVREALGFPPDEFDEHPDVPPPVDLPE